MKNRIRVKVIHNAVSDMTKISNMEEFPSKIYRTFVSVRNDRHIMEHKNSDINSPVADYLLGKVKALESQVFAVLKRRDGQEKQFKEITFREVQIFEMTKNAEMALLKAKLTKQRSTIIRQKQLIKKLAVERNTFKKRLNLISKRQKSKKNMMKNAKKELTSIPPESEEQLICQISQKCADLTSDIESVESENVIPASEKESESDESHSATESISLSKKTSSAETEVERVEGDDILSEENEAASTAEAGSEEICEIEVDVVAEATREIEILSEKKDKTFSLAKQRAGNLLRRKSGGSRKGFSRAGEERLKSQVVVFVGKWLKKNVSSFDYSEANIMVVQGKTHQFCNEIKRGYLSSNVSLDGIQLSLDQKAAITKNLEKSYSS